MSVTHYRRLDAAVRREAVTEAVASVRAEGLEPSVRGLALLEAVATGMLDEDQAIELLRARHSA